MYNKNKPVLYMRIAIKTVLFHILCIIFFSIIYFYFRDDFRGDGITEITFLDFIFLSTTIQSSVGLTSLSPIDFNGKLIMVIQQLLLILTHVFTIYVFTV
jgi:hypothetical protein